MIELKCITKRYGTTMVLNGVTLRVQPGECVALIGRSGVGKTTILRCIVGLEEIDDGGVKVDDIALRANHTDDNVLTALRRRVGLVFQNHALWPYRTALANMIEGLLYVRGTSYAEAVSRALDMAKRLGIDDHLGKYPDQLSGGQRQRVAIARCLLMEPKYLLLDEITSHLDIARASDILDLIDDYRRGGAGVLIATHQLRIARERSNRVCVLQNGAIVEEGGPIEVLGKGNNSVVKNLLESAAESLE